MRLRSLLGFALALLVLGGTRADAQVIGETPQLTVVNPDRFARGWFAEGDVGAALFLGKLGRYADPGPQLSARLGYDVLRWLALEAHGGGVTAGADAPAPRTGQAFQLYFYTLDARAQLQLRRIGLYLDAGAGGATFSNNLFGQLGVAPKRTSVAVTGGLGFDWHTLNRHFSVGVAADYMWLALEHSSHALMFATYLRYTR